MVKYCYYINLETRPDRKYLIEGELKKSKHLADIYERFPAVDGREIHPRDKRVEGLLTENAICDILSDNVSAWGLSMTSGGMGVMLSYIDLFKKISELDSPAITFEDDIILADNFDERLEQTLKELPEDFDLCYLGYGDVNAEGEKVSDFLSIPKGRVYCLPALIVSPEGAKKMLDFLKNLDNQIDTTIFLNFNKLNVYITNEKIVTIKNHMGTDIQGNGSLVKNYKKQNYIFSTLAFGYGANDNAIKLAKDLKYFGQKILIVTNMAYMYKKMDNVIAVEYPKDTFSYNDKIFCFEEGFKHEDCVVYVDSDCRVFYENYKKSYGNFRRIVAPGFHNSWDWGIISRPDSGFFTSTDIEHRVAGYGEKALNIANQYSIDVDKAYHYQEGIIIVSKEQGKERMFLDMWRKFAEELDQHEKDNNAKRIGVGEGNIIGMCVVYANLTVNGPDIANYLGQDVLYNFYGASRDDYMKRMPGRKMIKKTDGVILKESKHLIEYNNGKIKLNYQILEIDENLLCLTFEWDLNGVIEFLDHEFQIGENVYHFNSEKTNEFYFDKKNNIEIYHTYDWYGNKDLKLIETLYE